jgi:hypothetical protein
VTTVCAGGGVTAPSIMPRWRSMFSTPATIRATYGPWSTIPPPSSITVVAISRWPTVTVVLNPANTVPSRPLVGRYNIVEPKLRESASSFQI